MQSRNVISFFIVEIKNTMVTHSHNHVSKQIKCAPKMTEWNEFWLLFARSRRRSSHLRVNLNAKTQIDDSLLDTFVS